MNTLPTNPEQPDELDRLLSDYFKAQLRYPWPNAPVAPTAVATATTEPSGLVNRSGASARRDSTSRARFTLAASVALALGASWMLVSGFEPAAFPGGMPTAPRGPGMLPGSGADGTDHLPLQKMQENNAKPPKIDLGNGE